MAVNFQQFYFTNLPEDYYFKDGTMTLLSRPHTSLWANTDNNKQETSACMLMIKLPQEAFTFSFKVKFYYCEKGDQCGLILFVNDDNWIKQGIEYGDIKSSYLGSTVTNNGYSDYAFQGLRSNIKEIYYRLSKRNKDFLLECSFDGEQYFKMRITHLENIEKNVDVGMFVSSPNDSSFKAEFSKLSLTKCIWKKV